VLTLLSNCSVSLTAKQLLTAQRTVHTIDFQTVTSEELQNFYIDFSFRIDTTSLLHGIAAWFDLDFNGSDNKIVLSTAPDQPGTHWYQCRLLLREPIAVNNGQSVNGRLDFEANDKFSYFLDLKARLDGTHVEAFNSRINLHDQMYHYLYGGGASDAGY
jgi:histone-arginine methyltransferase CARM1